jgi:hypothetical protein
MEDFDMVPLSGFLGNGCQRPAGHCDYSAILRRILA